MLIVACSRQPGASSAPPQSNANASAALDAQGDGAPPDAGDPLTIAAPGDRPPNTIYRSEIDYALSRGPGYLLYELAPEPYRLSGKFVGWEITQVFPDEPNLCIQGCDLMVGYIILSVNGDRLETPQALSDMIDALPRTDTLTIKSIRDEKRRVRTYTLRE